MSSWTQQAVIEAPVSAVWELLEDVGRYPDWNENTVSVTGAPTEIEKGSRFEIKDRGPLGLAAATPFEVETLDDMREIKLRCQVSGYYSRWRLTEAQGGTFAEVELGVERVPGVTGAVTGAMVTKRYLRKTAEETLDNLTRAVTSDPG